MINSDGFKAMIKDCGARMANGGGQRFAYEVRTRGTAGIVVGNTPMGRRAAQFSGETTMYAIADIATLPRADRLAICKAAIVAQNRALALEVAATLDAQVVARATAALNLN